ncbi:MAG: hypothetical protein ACRDMZ_04885, partial [Solirubrobacteraceae bacterium]
LRVGLPAIFVVLWARGCVVAGRPAAALELGSGLRATATVEARKLGGEWQDCGYTQLTGEYHCDGLVSAYDSTASLINDAPPSWAFVTPAISASADTVGVEIRIRLRARLAGTYEAAVSEGTALVSLDDGPAKEIEREVLDLADRGERAIEIRGSVPLSTWSFTFVRQDAIVPARPFLEGPPDEAPASVRAIGH